MVSPSMSPGQTHHRNSPCYQAFELERDAKGGRYSLEQVCYNSGMAYYVTSTRQARLQTWERVVGTVLLPVKWPHPRMQETRHGRRLAFDLDVQYLHPGQVFRLSAYVAFCVKHLYEDIYREVKSQGYPLVDNGDVVVVESEIEMIVSNNEGNHSEKPKEQTIYQQLMFDLESVNRYSAMLRLY